MQAGRTCTLFEYPLGKPLEAKLLKELGNSGATHIVGAALQLFGLQHLNHPMIHARMSTLRGSSGLQHCDHPCDGLRRTMMPTTPGFQPLSSGFRTPCDDFNHAISSIMRGFDPGQDINHEMI